MLRVCVSFYSLSYLPRLTCSVLGTLVKNKAVPDPFYGLNNEAIIDIADSGREHYTFWFFTTFQCKLVCCTLAKRIKMCSLKFSSFK